MSSGFSVGRIERIGLAEWVSVLIATDLLGVILLSTIIFGSYQKSFSSGAMQFWAGVAGFIIAWGLASHSQNLYGRDVMFAARRTLLLRAVAACALSFGLILSLAFGLKVISEVSRFWLLTWAASAFLWVIASRIVMRRCLFASLRRGRCLDRALVLTGIEPAAAGAAETIEAESEGRIRVVSATLIPGLSGAPSFSDIAEAIRADLIDRVFIADYDGAVPETNALLARLTHFAVDVTLVPNLRNVQAPPVRVARIGMLATVDVASRPLNGLQAVLKRAEDLVLASLMFLVALPALVLIAIAIKLDSRGPVLFRQIRVGFHDQVFPVWKFRTMRHDPNDNGPLRQTARGDDRITRVGRLLRRTSLDELPQLFNVLSGEMSIVGPRPHAKTMTTAGQPLHVLLDDYISRHRVKPGITGWAQVNGCRGEVNTEEKLRRRVMLDCQYIENWSLALDAWIILRTAAMLLFDRHAY